MNPGKEASRKRALYHQRVESGVCVDCGKERAANGTRRCVSCGKKASKRTVKYQRRVQGALVKLHICRYCRMRLPMEGRTYCGVCAEVQVDRQRGVEARRRERGLCPRCGKARDREDRTLCAGCRLMQNRRGRRFRGKNLRKTYRLHPEAA